MPVTVGDKTCYCCRAVVVVVAVASGDGHDVVAVVAVERMLVLANELAVAAVLLRLWSYSRIILWSI